MPQSPSPGASSVADASRLSALYRLLVSSLPSSAVMVFDHDLRFVFADGPELARNNTSKAQLEGRRLSEAVDPQFAALVEPNIRAALAGRRFRAELPFGELMYAYTYEPLVGDDGAVIYALVFAQDVTPLYEARRRALQNEARMRELVGSLPAVVFAIGADRRVRFIGGAATDLLGDTPEALVGSLVDERLAGEGRLIELLNRALAGERIHTDAEFNGVTWDIHYSPVMAADGSVTEVIGVAVDVTEERRIEFRNRQRQKLEAIGRLAGGVAHDFNNMLMVIRGNADLALQRLDADHPLQEYLVEIRTASEQSARLAQQMLAFARQQPASPKIIDLNVAIPATLQMLRRVIAADVELSWTPGHDVGLVKVDPVQLNQALTNLCLNARDAITGVGHITVMTHHASMGASPGGSDRGGRSGGYAVLSVKDDGVGMAPDVLEHIFEPFFTTKSVGAGTGLGLSTVFGIAKQHGGFVTATSELGRGSTFDVYLPEVTGTVEDTADAGVAAAPSTGRETVLLVEDEPAVLAVGRAILQSLGYEVLTAASPAAAVALVERYAGAIHLLISDVVMPGMNGRELADRLLELRPGLCVLFISGYSATVTQRGVDGVGVGFLQKPFSANELAARVRGVLDARG